MCPAQESADSGRSCEGNETNIIAQSVGGHPERRVGEANSPFAAKRVALPEGGGGALRLLLAPPLALPQGQVPDGVVSGSAIVQFGELLEARFP